MKRFLLCVLFALGIALAPLVSEAAKSYSGGGSRSSSSTSSGNRSTARPSTPSRSSPPPSSSSPRSSPAQKSSGSSGSSSSANKSAPKSNYDSGASSSQKRQESKAAYSASKAKTVANRPVSSYKPKSEYRTASGQVKKINTTDVRVTKIRETYTYNTYVTRTTRMTTYYGPSYSIYVGRPVVVYNDPINTIFWYWMLDQSLDRQAMWMYHHRDEVDDARYKELCAKNAELDAKIKALEAKGEAKNPNYVPEGMDPDLQYTDDYVKAVTSVDEAEKDVKAAEAEDAAAAAAANESFFKGVTFWGICKFFIVLLLIIAGTWILIAYIMWRKSNY